MPGSRRTQRKKRSESERRFWKDRLRSIYRKNLEKGITRLTKWKSFQTRGGGKNMYGFNNFSEENYSLNSENNQNNNTNCQEKSFIEKTVTFNGKNYTYREEEGGDYLYLFRGEAKRYCFEIDIQIDSENKKYAHLRSFYNFSDCSQQKNSNGKDLFLAVVELLKQRKDIISYMDLTDDSGKELPNGKKIPLGDMYFVCTGETWYGSLLPLVPDKMIAEDINISRKKVRRNRWNNVYNCLKARYPSLTIPVDISDIDTTKPGSAMQVFRRIKEAKTDFFADYGYNISVCSGYRTISGTVWRYYFPSSV
jgi:hypothetical protein